MRLLVTGAAGFIGSNFVRYWLGRRPDDHVVALDLLTYAGDRRNLAGLGESLVFVEGDIGDLELGERVLAEEQIDVVVNFAAESHNSLAVLDPGRFFRTNVLGTQTLLEASRRAGIRRFHHVSTCEVYGDLPLDGDESFTEESPYRPRTPYNASKAGADHAVRAYFETFELPVTITNCSNNYGPRQFPEKVIPLFVDERARRPRAAALRVDAEPARVAARRRPLPRDRARAPRARPRGETYNVGSGVERSIEEIADLVLELTGEPPALKTIVPDRPGPRPPLPARLVEAAPRARLGAAGRLRGGSARDRRVVPRQPRLVGAAPGAGAGRGVRGLALLDVQAATRFELATSGRIVRQHLGTLSASDASGI